MRAKSSADKASRSAWEANLVVPALLTRMSMRPKASSPAAARLAHNFRGVLRLALASRVVDHHIGAAAGERDGGCGADSGGGAGHDGRPAFQIARFHVRLRRPMFPEASILTIDHDPASFSPRERPGGAGHQSVRAGRGGRPHHPYPPRPGGTARVAGATPSRVP